MTEGKNLWFCLILINLKVTSHMWMVAAILVSVALGSSCIMVMVMSITRDCEAFISMGGKEGEEWTEWKGIRGLREMGNGCQKMDVPRGTELYCEGIEDMVRLLSLGNNFTSGKKQRGQSECAVGKPEVQILSYCNQHSLWAILILFWGFLCKPGKNN